MSDDTLRPSFADDFLWTDPDRRRAHPLWRLIAAAVTMTGLGIVALVVLTSLSPIQSPLLRSIGLSVAAIATVLVLARTLDDGRSLRRYGLDVDRSWWREAIVGALLAVVGASVPAVLGLGIGWYEHSTVLPTGWGVFVSGAITIAVHVAFVALWEELFFRGLVVTNTVELVGSWSRRLAVAGGVLVSAWWFASVHEAHPDRPVLYLTWLLAGVVFAALYLASGRLALPIGAHAGYNFWHSALFNDRALEEGLAGAVRGFVEVEGDASVLLVGSGGLVQALGFVLVLVLGLAWLRYDRGSLRNRWLRSVSHLDAESDAPDRDAA